MSGHWSTSTSAGAAIVFLGDQSPVPTQDRIRGDDARDLRQDPPAEFVTAHSESTTLGVRQAKRPRAQVFSEDPILLPEIVDQIVLVTVHPASEREDEELQRRRHSLRLLGRLDQHRPSLGRFFAPYEVIYQPRFTYVWTLGVGRFPESLTRRVSRDTALREIARCFLAGAGMTIRGEMARVSGLSRPEAGRGNRALVAEGYATMPASGVYQLAARGASQTPEQ